MRFAFDEFQQILMAFWAHTLNNESMKGIIYRYDYTSDAMTLGISNMCWGILIPSLVNAY